MNKPENHILVIFGASGDLTYRKLIPAVYDLHKQNLLPEKFAVLGASRTKLTDEKFRDKMKDGIKKYSNFKNDDGKMIDDFLNLLSYISVDTENPENFNSLKSYLTKLDGELGTNGNVIYYLSTPPSLFVQDSGEGRWTVQTAIDLDVPAHIITSSLFNRFQSRQNESFAMKMLAALRNEFGGHAVKKSGTE